MAKITDNEVAESAFSLIQATIEHFKQLRRNSHLTAEWKAAENSYFNGSDDFYKGLSRVKVPALHQAVERVVPKMDKVLFPPDGEFLGVAAKDQNDDLAVDDAQAVSSLIKQQFKDVDVRSKLIGIYRSLCIYGTVFIKTFWDKREQRRFKREDGKRVEKFVTVFDNPDFYSPDIWDVYADPKDENLEGWVIEKVPVEFNDLWNLRKRKENGQEVGLYDAKTLEELRDMSVAKDQDDRDKLDSERTKGLGGHKFGPHQQKLFLWQAQGNVPKWFLTKNEEDRKEKTTVENAIIEIVTTDGMQGKFLRVDDNPNDHGEKMIKRGRYIRIDGRLYGLGMMSVNIPLEAELNTIRNQLIDMQTFNLKRKWIVDRNANVTESELQNVNNKIVYTDLMSGLKDIAPADFSASGSAHMRQIMQDIEDSTGASKLLSGTPSGTSLDRTAAGVATVVQGGLERFELVVTQFQEEIMKPLVKQFWMLNQQFLPEGRDIAMTGKGIIRVRPEEIALEGFDLNFLGVRELGEKEFKINALNILLQNLSPFIPLGLDPIPVVMRFFKLTGMGDLAQEVDRRPENDLEETPEGEIQLLRLGRNVKINLNDNHLPFIQAYQQLLQQADLPENVKANTLEALGQRLLAQRIQQDGIKSTSGATDFGGTPKTS